MAGDPRTYRDQMAAALLNRLGRVYVRNPLLCNVGLYGSLYGLGDVSQQAICGKNKNIDLHSAARVSTVGASVFGPFYYFWYRVLERHIPGRTTRNIVKKVVMDQAIAGSGGVFLFFVATSTLEGADNIFDDAIVKGPKAFMTGCVYWPMVQLMNFAFVPPAYRAVYVAGAAFVWTNILCYIKFSKLNTVPV